MQEPGWFAMIPAGFFARFARSREEERANAKPARAGERAKGAEHEPPRNHPPNTTARRREAPRKRGRTERRGQGRSEREAARSSAPGAETAAGGARAQRAKGAQRPQGEPRRHTTLSDISKSPTGLTIDAGTQKSVPNQAQRAKRRGAYREKYPQVSTVLPCHDCANAHTAGVKKSSCFSTFFMVEPRITEVSLSLPRVIAPPSAARHFKSVLSLPV